MEKMMMDSPEEMGEVCPTCGSGMMEGTKRKHANMLNEKPAGKSKKKPIHSLDEMKAAIAKVMPKKGK